MWHCVKAVIPDMISNQKSPDAVLRRISGDELDWSEAAIWTFTEVSEGTKRKFTFDIPYRAFLPNKKNNLISAGACLSCTWGCIVQALRLIPWCMTTGEVAGQSAVIAVKQEISAKEVEWTHYFTDQLSRPARIPEKHIRACALHRIEAPDEEKQKTLQPKHWDFRELN